MTIKEKSRLERIPKQRKVKIEALLMKNEIYGFRPYTFILYGMRCE